MTSHRDLTASLQDLLKGHVCIVGMGNRHRGDDGAGPGVIDARPPGTPGFWLDAGSAVENFLEPIAEQNPDTVLLVDAVAFGGYPGECRLMEPKMMVSTSVSTHVGSPAMLSEYLLARTGARIRMMAIQPESLDAGEGLSPPVRNSVVELATRLSSLLRLGTDSTGLH